ncbi:MAG: FAD-dependent oxidoreductase [Thermoprotei archaeon]
MRTHAEYELRLISVETHTSTIKTFTFDASGSGFSFTAGQYLRLELEGVAGDPRGNRRDFSISSPATNRGEYISVTTTIEPNDSPFKHTLNTLKPGDRAKIVGPFGSFTLEPLSKDVEVVLVAGGMGITPFRSIIHTELKIGSRKRITLLYSAKTAENLVFKQEFDELSAKHQNFKAYYTLTRPSEAQNYRVGRIDAEYVRSLTHPKESVYYIAGPPAMVEDLSQQLAEKLSLSPQQVKVEKFTGY